MSRPKFSRAINDDFVTAIEALRTKGAEISFSSVAKEANRSRGLISREGTGYGDVRKQVLSLRRAAARQQPKSSKRTVLPRDEELTSLRSEVRVLSDLVDGLQSALAATIVRDAASATARTGGQLADLEQRRAGAAKRRQAESVR